MVETIATATEMQNNFGHYLNIVLSGKEVIITKNGREVARVVPKSETISFLTDSLTGVLKNSISIEEARAERVSGKYETIH